MDPQLAMLLPKGLMINTDEIYQEVASYPVVPPEKIWEYWHVYTTTFRKLIDPTAHRLENFWWHVWGSDRRHLSGKALARLYEDISTGPTFTQNRRRSSPPEAIKAASPIQATQSTFTEEIQGSPSDRQRSARDQSPIKKASDAATKNFSSSASRPPPPHPILKKSRGPSSSGPRPTARFISPHESEDEEVEPVVDEEAVDSKENDDASSASTTNTSSAMKAPSYFSPTKSDKRKPPITTKKFHASSSASKRRPVIARRPSSQSSIGSDTVSRDGGSSVNSRQSGTQRLVPLSSVELKASSPLARSQASTGSASRREKTAAHSAKPGSIRPTGSTRNDKRVALPNSSLPSSSTQIRPLVVQARAPAVQTRSSDDIPVYEVSRLSSRPTQPDIQGVRSGTAGHGTTSNGPRTRSDWAERGLSRNLSLGRAPPLGLLSGTTAGTTTVAAQGSLIGTNDPLVPPPITSDVLDHIIDEQDEGSAMRTGYLRRGLEGELISRPSTSSLLGDLKEPAGKSLPSRSSTTSLLNSTRFRPTQPSTADIVTVPLGRSKSQLTLLLEREKARIGDKPRSKS